MNLSTSLTITALYTSLLTLIFITLSINIIRLRFKLKVGLGDGGEKRLTQAIRAHGNFAEYVPLALLLLASYELSGANSVFLHVLGATLLIGRLLHVIGLSKSMGSSVQRAAGMISTFIVLIILAVENIRTFIIA